MTARPISVHKMAMDQGCDLHLRTELDLLRQSLLEKQNQLMDMETQCLRESDRQAELEDSLVAWQDKYDRLSESHKRVQKVNQALEDKLLKMANINAVERSQWSSDVAKLSVGLADANYLISNLRREIDRYKTDMSLAIQLLRCNPEGSSVPKISSLSKDMQRKLTSIVKLDSSDTESLASGVTPSDRRPSTFLSSTSAMALSNINNNQDSHCNVMYRVLPASESPPPPGVCPFPPTAMVYSMRGVDAKIDTDEITPGLMAKYLEEEILAADQLTASLKSGSHSSAYRREGHDDQEKTTSVTATSNPPSYSIGTQTNIHGGDSNNSNSLCLRCNSNLNSPSRTSSFVMKLGAIEVNESKSSLSTLSTANTREDNVIGCGRKEDLQVNPILGHHRLCDRREMINGAQLVGSASTKKSGEQSSPHSNSFKVVPQVSDENGTTIGVMAADRTINNVLIKNIKMSEHMNKSMNRPRLCSLRITAEGAAATTNILLENAGIGRLNCDTVSIVSQEQPQIAVEKTVEKQVYTKRSKYLDEELDDTKEVIVCLDRRRPVVAPTDSPGKVSQQLIELSNNRTDSEKLNHSHKNTHYTSKNGKVEGESVGGGGEDQNTFLLDDPVPAVENLRTVMDMTTNGGGNNSDSSNLPMTTNTLLRQEQLNRVAVWVQQSNNQLDPLHPKCSSVSSSLSGSNASQLMTMRRTTVAGSSATYSGDVCIDIEDVPSTANERVDAALAMQNNSPSGALLVNGSLNVDVAAVSVADSDIAQMEYNVKQFLLKQNEWSIGRLVVEGSPTLPVVMEQPLQSHSMESMANMYSLSPLPLNNNNNLRTETNL